MNSNGIAYRPEVDGLRAIAVLSVVLYHAGVAVRAGFVGVDVFFVISGYLITALLLREWSDTGRIDLPAFYARRVRRIFPAAVVVVLAVLAAGPLFMAPGALIRLQQSAAASALFGANFYFQSMTGGYFDPSSSEMPLLHLWSLAVEEQFYLCWPLLLIVLLKCRPKALASVLAGLGLASFALAELWMHRNPDAAFYQMPARFWELAAGGLIAVVPARRGLPAWVADVAVLMLLAACTIPMGHFPLLAVAGSVALLCAVHGEGDLGWAGRWLRSRPMAAIGLISYSLYLWHWPLLAFYRATSIGEGSSQVRLLLCAVAILLAAASYRYVEQPFRRAQWRKGWVVTLGVAVSLSVACAAFAWSRRIEREEAARPVDNPLAVKAENDYPADWRRCHYTGWANEFPRANCQSVPGKAPSIVMWGDSMAMAWKPLAWEMGRQAGQSAIDYSRDSCPPFVGYMSAENVPNDIRCRDFNAKVAEAAKGADTVILVSRWGGDQSSDSVARTTAGLRATLHDIAPTVRRVLIIGPTPELRDEVPKCIRANKPDACAVTRSEFDARAEPNRNLIRSVAKEFGNVELVDPTDFFCTATTCAAVKDGVPLYWDSHHVSASAARAFALEYLSKYMRVPGSSSAAGRLH